MYRFYYVSNREDRNMSKIDLKLLNLVIKK